MPHPRDAMERVQNPLPPHNPRWRDLSKAVFIGLCILTENTEHIWIKCEKLLGIAQEIRAGSLLPTSGSVIMTAVLTLALVVVIMKDWTEMGHEISSHVDMARTLFKGILQKFKKS